MLQNYHPEFLTETIFNWMHLLKEDIYKKGCWRGHQQQQVAASPTKRIKPMRIVTCYSKEHPAQKHSQLCQPKHLFIPTYYYNNV